MQRAETEGRGRMYNARNSRLPGPPASQKALVGPLDCAPRLDLKPPPAPGSKTSCLAELGQNDAPTGKENHGRGRSDMCSHLRTTWRPRPTNVLEEKPQDSFARRATTRGWTKISPPKQEKAPKPDLRTIHRSSLDPDRKPAVKRGDRRRAESEASGLAAAA
ncbi:unnamed protein product [Effrenium voratum]|nr:unnamed protein product [Effrenium voratum]